MSVAYVEEKHGNMLRDVGEVFWWHICLPSRGREFDSPHPHMNEPLRPRLDKGPTEMLRALASGDPEQIAAAKEFQRESFKAKLGYYPEDLEAVYCPDCEDPSLPWWARIAGCTCGYVSNLITEQIENDPVEVEKLRRSRQQARDGYTTPLREALGDDDGPGAT